MIFFISYYPASVVPPLITSHEKTKLGRKSNSYHWNYFYWQHIKLIFDSNKFQTTDRYQNNLNQTIFSISLKFSDVGSKIIKCAHFSMFCIVELIKIIKWCYPICGLSSLGTSTPDLQVLYHLFAPQISEVHILKVSQPSELQHYTHFSKSKLSSPN